MDLPIKNDWYVVKRKEIRTWKGNSCFITLFLCEKEKNYILVLATTTNDHTIETYKKYNQNIISKAPLDSIFDLIYSKGAVKNLKPNPEIHYKILETLNVKPEECLIVEDSLIGIEAAINANIDFIVMYDKFSDGNREKINKVSSKTFNDFNELLETIVDEIES